MDPRTSLQHAPTLDSALDYTMGFVFHSGSLKGLDRKRLVFNVQSHLISNTLQTWLWNWHRGKPAHAFFRIRRTVRPFTNILIIASKFPAMCTSAPQFREIPQGFAWSGPLYYFLRRIPILLGSWPSAHQIIALLALLRTVELLTWNEKKLAQRRYGPPLLPHLWYSKQAYARPFTATKAGAFRTRQDWNESMVLNKIFKSLIG